MKRILSLLFILALLCTASAASAQEIEIHREDNLFYIVVTLPSGARVTDYSADEYFSLTKIDYVTAGMPSVVITAAPDELYTGQSLSDLPKDDIDLIINEITVEMTNPVTEIRSTANGYEYIAVNESTADNDACDCVMLINGYFVMVHVYHTDFSELTPDEVTIGPSIIETLRFVGNTNS